MSEPERPENETRNQRPQDPASAAGVAAGSREMAARLSVIGAVTWLCSRSSIHKDLFISDIEWRTFPPILLGQYRLISHSRLGGLPTAFASWAFLSPERERGYLRTHRLQAGDWRSGDRLWLIDFITPFGGAHHLLDVLCHRLHPDREINLLYPGDRGAPEPVTLSELRRRYSEPQPEAPDGVDGEPVH